MTLPGRAFVCLLFGATCVLLAAAVRADDAPEQPRSFEQLPAALRSQIGLGEPRASDQIPDSPFGTLTTVCYDRAEPSGPSKSESLASAIAAAGYKWVGDYIQADWSKTPSTPEEIAAWSGIATACTAHLARLQAHNIHVLMRIDALPTGKLAVTKEQLALAKTFTRNVVARLKLYIKHWQLGNEPNAPEAYVRATTELARVVRAEQPDAVVYGPRLEVSGEDTSISANGEQRVTPVIEAKAELRRALSDFAQGITPRMHCSFYRRMPETAFSYEGSSNTINKAFEKKPLYYAAQNLHAVLDTTYSRVDNIKVSVKHAPSAGSNIQTYLKHHGSFDELLIFFWSPTPAEDLHVRKPVSLQLSAAEHWEAPILIDLMTMPGNARPSGFQPSAHKRTTFPAAQRDVNNLQLDGLELRDYPQVLKLIRVTSTAVATGLRESVAPRAR